MLLRGAHWSLGIVSFQRRRLVLIESESWGEGEGEGESESEGKGDCVIGFGWV